MNLRFLVWTYKLREEQTRTARAGLAAQARARQPVKVMMQPWMLVLACAATSLCPALSQVSTSHTSLFSRENEKNLLNVSPY